MYYGCKISIPLFKRMGNYVNIYYLFIFRWIFTCITYFIHKNIAFHVNTISNYLELDERLLIDYDDTDLDKVDLIEVEEEIPDNENTISNVLNESKEKSKKKLGKVYSNVIEEIKE